jgi:REP element-mobilizing transposase RayT
MANTYTTLLVHYVFSTKRREKIIKGIMQERLWPYIGGIARENKMKAHAVGGTEDHVHLLLSLPATISVSKAIQLIKGGSSIWINNTFPDYNKKFRWQEGYGAFTVGISHIEDTISYINNQKEHHKVKTFQEEYIAFLKKHNIKYDEKYVWD